MACIIHVGVQDYPIRLALRRIGFFIMAFAKTRRRQAIGEVLVGFGMLFIGLEFMEDAFAPLKDTTWLKDLFVRFSDHPLLGVFVGMIFTVLLQSSSATIVIVQVLAFNGLISFEAAIPLILGDNIGTTITAQLSAAAGTNLNARRAAMSHTVFNVIGVAYMLIFVYSGLYVKAVDMLVPGVLTTQNVMVHIAVAHSLFNVTNVIIFLPFVGLLEKISIVLVPKKKGVIEPGPQYLEKRLLETPPLAMEQVKNEVIYMLKVASKSVRFAIETFMNNDIIKIRDVLEYERVTDNLQSEITQYLIDLSQRELSSDESEELPVWIHNVNDIERIADHSQNIAELARRKIEEKLPFTEEANNEINLMWNEVQQMLQEG
jgi:phosphate:Na+ symporter